MDIYHKLNVDLKNMIDYKYYNKYVKPIQNNLIKELYISQIPKCRICKKPLRYIDFYGNIEFYIRPHHLCISCDDYMSNVEINYDSEESEESMDIDDFFNLNVSFSFEEGDYIDNM
tara:strand:+ start:269 stop:616 length:348 start_codon:yes stop_codon:yes gene_type:complete